MTRRRDVRTHKIVCATCSYSFRFTTGLRKTTTRMDPPLECEELNRLLEEKGKVTDPDPLMFCENLRRAFEATTGVRAPPLPPPEA